MDRTQIKRNQLNILLYSMSVLVCVDMFVLFPPRATSDDATCREVGEGGGIEGGRAQYSFQTVRA